MKVVISSGHGKHIRGASDILDEVDEARRVVEQVAIFLRSINVDVETFHDDISTTQNENLNRIVSYHNSCTRDLDVSVHFNAYEHTSKGMGTECLYVTQQALSQTVAGNISSASGLINRGPKKRTDLYFLNNTTEPAILIEVCFVDSQADADIYRANFELICNAIAEAISGQTVEPVPPELPEPAPPDVETPIVDIKTHGNVRIRVNGLMVEVEAP
jgi:N-acetylmuramoyl-L-alanine amidase